MKNRNLKILVLVVAALFAMTLAVGCFGGNDPAPGPDAGNGGDAVQTTTLTAGTTLDPTHPYNRGMEYFSNLLYERTDGRFNIQIFHSAQLGSERELIEGIQMGTVDVTVVSTAPLMGFSEAYMVTDLPFIFEDREHAYRVLDGPIGQDMLDQLAQVSIKGLANWENGFRHITNSVRPINGPADLNGLTIRTMENQIHMDSFLEIGADPVPMAFGELFTALQQGTVSGQENPLANIYTSRFYEVQGYLALTGHFYSPAPLLMSLTLWNSLSAEDQAIFQQAAIEARDAQRQMVYDMEQVLVGDLEAAGMQVSRPSVADFQEAMAPVYEAWSERIGSDLIEQVRALAN